MVRALVLIAAATIAAPAAAAAPHPLELRNLRAAVGLGTPQISPDGTRVAVVVRRGDYEHDRYRTELVAIDVRSGARTPLTRGRDGIANVQWSPQGDRVAFTALPPADPAEKTKPVPQIFVIALSGGDALQVTHAATAVSNFAWRPDGRAFAFSAEDEPPNKRAIEAHEDLFEVTDAAWTERAAHVPVQLWTIGAGGGRASRLTSGPASVSGGFGYTRDGRGVFFSRAPSAGNHYRATAVALVDVVTKRVRVVTEPQRRAVNPQAARDGRHLVYERERRGTPSQTDVDVADADGSHARSLTQRLDRNVQFVALSPDGEGVFVGANNETRDRLYRVRWDGSWSAVPLGEANVQSGATVSRNGTLAFAAAQPLRPVEVYVLAPGSAAPRRLTGYNDAITARALTPTHTVSWRTWDGMHADGALTEPAGYRRGRRYPLVMLIHGGPTATSTTSYNGLVQLMAARGWFVFQPNYRGSDNLGARWAQATVPHITSAPARDCEEGLAAVLKRGDVDTARIGVSGWSEGGLMTSWLITHDTRWRAAMSGAAVNDWVQYADMTDAKDFAPSFIGPSPWTSDAMMKLYEDESPLTYADRVRTPTLIMTDAGDQRVPTPLDYEFYHAIRATGTPVEMVVFPVNGHNPADPVRNEDRTRRWVEWFARHF